MTDTQHEMRAPEVLMVRRGMSPERRPGAGVCVLNLLAAFWSSTGPTLAVLTPLIGVPLTVITFYLRSLRDQQVSWQSELRRRFETLETSTRELRRHVDDFEREYTTKEEWLRECMHARRVLEHLTETTARLDAAMNTVLATLRNGTKQRD